MLLAWGLAVVAWPASAEIYRWIDPQGRVHFTDRPPDKSTAQVLRPKVVTYSGAPVMETLGKIQGAMISKTLKLYSRQGCGYCKSARAYLRQRGIGFTDIDVESSEQAAAEYRSLGALGVPIFVLGNRKMLGFDETSMDAFLARPRP